MNPARIGKSDWLRFSLVFGVAIVFLLPTAASANERAAAEKMLTAYEQTVRHISSFRIEGIAKEWDHAALQGDPEKLTDAFSRMTKTTVVHHDFRWKVAQIQQRPPRAGDRVRYAPLSGVEYRFDDFLGANQGLHIQWASPDADEPVKLDHLAVRLMGAAKGDEHSRYLDCENVLFGFMPGDNQQPVWKVMREAATLELLPDTKIIAQHKTHVIRSTGAFGTHTLCLDPEFGFLPRQIVIQRQNGHLFNAIQLGVEQNPSARLPEAARARLQARGMLQPAYTITESENRLANLQLSERHGQFVITDFDHSQQQTVKSGDRTEQKQNRTEYRTQVFDLRPDSWPADALQTAVDIPNGTPVSTSDGVKSFVWMNGKVE